MNGAGEGVGIVGKIFESDLISGGNDRTGNLQSHATPPPTPLLPHNPSTPPASRDPKVMF
jgi:hypothetical protein